MTCWCDPAVVAEGFASLALLLLTTDFPRRRFRRSPERTIRNGGLGQVGGTLGAVDRGDRGRWKGDTVEPRGKHHNVNARLYDIPLEPIPWLMAGNGPKAMRRAGKYGDGLMTVGR
jgi:luciferase-like monooxygenase